MTEEKQFEEMTAGDDGWCDWVHPEPGYLMQCCDCGLVHEVEVAVAVNSKELPDGSFEWEDGQTPENKAVWRMRRGNSPDENGSSACLIPAASDLLVSLQALLDAAWGPGEVPAPVFTAARAAIAKATGAPPLTLRVDGVG